MKVLTDRDIDILKALAAKSERLLTAAANRDYPQESIGQTSDAYVVQSPGIPSIEVGTGSPLEPAPGTALCQVYQLVDGKLILAAPKVVVNNIGAAIPFGTWIPVWRDRFGAWYCGAGTDGWTGCDAVTDACTGLISYNWYINGVMQKSTTPCPTCPPPPFPTGTGTHGVGTGSGGTGGPACGPCLTSRYIYHVTLPFFGLIALVGQCPQWAAITPVVCPGYLTLGYGTLFVLSFVPGGGTGALTGQDVWILSVNGHNEEGIACSFDYQAAAATWDCNSSLVMSPGANSCYICQDPTSSVTIIPGSGGGPPPSGVMRRTAAEYHTTSGMLETSGEIKGFTCQQGLLVVSVATFAGDSAASITVTYGPITLNLDANVAYGTGPNNGKVGVFSAAVGTQVHDVEIASAGTGTFLEAVAVNVTGLADNVPVTSSTNSGASSAPNAGALGLIAPPYMYVQGAIAMFSGTLPPWTWLSGFTAGISNQSSTASRFTEGSRILTSLTVANASISQSVLAWGAVCVPYK